MPKIAVDNTSKSPPKKLAARPLYFPYAHPKQMLPQNNLPMDLFAITIFISTLCDKSQLGREENVFPTSAIHVLAYTHINIFNHLGRTEIRQQTRVTNDM